MPTKPKSSRYRSPRPQRPVLPGAAGGIRDQPASGLLWGGRIWQPGMIDQFRQWLGSRGANLQDFRQRYPAAWARLTKVPPEQPMPGRDVWPIPGQLPPGVQPGPGGNPPQFPAKTPPVQPAPPDYQLPTPLPGDPRYIPPGLERGFVDPSQLTPPVNPEIPIEPPPEPQPEAPFVPNLPNQTATTPDPGMNPNPQLSQAPLGAYTDPEYEAQRAMLEQQTRQEYAQILRQLGFAQDGQFIPGEVETQANRQRTDLNRGRQQAATAAKQRAQQEGNLFSGFYAQNLADQTEPYVQGLVDLELALPRTLADYRQQALQTLSNYDLEHFALLAEAASRRAAAIGQGAE